MTTDALEMISRVRVVFATAALLSAAVIAVACKSGDAPAACSVDIDCPTGSFCRANICAVVAQDAGLDGDIVQCITPGSACSIDGDCCTPPCTGFRCAGGSSGTSGKTSSSGTSGTSGTSSGTSGTSSGTSGIPCTDIYGLCTIDTDCCVGLSCTNGACR